MFNDLSAALQRPDLWQRSTEPFWDDEHISKQMLDAHLNPNWDAASRKPETIDRSVEWLSTFLPVGGNVLDLGCGPGLYAKRLAARGYAVTGVDLSRRSIDYAKAHDPATTYLCQDYLSLDFSSTFDAALLIYADYAALTAPERAALLPKVYRALKPGGFFVLDVFTDVRFADKADHTSWAVYPKGGFWSPEPHLTFDATRLYENHTVAVDQTVVVTESTVTPYLIWDTAYTKERLLAEILPAGFTEHQILDDVCGTPYTGQAETLCAVLRKA